MGGLTCRCVGRLRVLSQNKHLPRPGGPTEELRDLEGVKLSNSAATSLESIENFAWSGGGEEGWRPTGLPPRVFLSTVLIFQFSIPEFVN